MPSTGTPRGPDRATARRDVRSILGMEFASGIGDGVFWVGLAAYLIDDGAGPAGFALAAAARFGPRALISAPAGALADRVDRRRLLVWLDLVRAALMGLLAVAAAAEVRYEYLLLLVLASYSLAAPYRPALTAALPLVVGEDHLAPSNALIGTTRQIMTFVGPVVGSGVLLVWSPAPAFAINAASFAVAALLISRVRSLGNGVAGNPTTSGAVGGPRPGGGTGGTWREVWGTAGLAVVALLVFTMYLARGAELILLVFLAEDQLGMGASGVGILTGALGLGALAALPLAPRMADSDQPALMTILALASTAIPLPMLALVESPVVACVALVVVGAGVVVFETLSVVLLQRLAALDVLGRVFGLVGSASNSGKLLGALGAPLLVAQADLALALVLTGVGVGVVGVASTPSLRAVTQTLVEHRRAIRPLVDELDRLALFDGASRAAIERIASAVETESVAQGSVIIRQGDPADDLFVVRSGAFVVTEGPHVVNRISGGGWVGEIGILQHRPRTATVTAEAASEVLRIPGDVFLAELQSGAAPANAVFETMATRLAVSERLRDH